MQNSCSAGGDREYPMQYDLLIFGASGHAMVACDCAQREYRHIIMLAGEETESVWHGIPVIPESRKNLQEWRELCPRAFVAIGNAARREMVSERLEAAGFQLVILRHSSAVVSSSAVLGDGTMIGPGSVVNADAVLGKGCIVNSGAIVEHECYLGNFVHLSPGAALGGGAVVGDRSWICIGASVSDHVRIGVDSTIGAGAAVINDIPNHVLAAGIPAVIKKTYR